MEKQSLKRLSRRKLGSIAKYIVSSIIFIFSPLLGIDIITNSWNNLVSAFDPVSSNKRNGNFEEALRPYSTFHNWGLGTEEESKRNPSIKTIQQTMAELGHTGKTIDIFVSTILLPLQG